MSSSVLAAMLLVVAACARETAEDRLILRTDEAVPLTMCELKPGEKCGSGTLPRLSERAFSLAELRAFLARAAQGTVAVAMVDEKPRLISDCKLPGKYVEVAGKPDRGRLWAASAGAVFVPEELPAACLEATHVVVDYVTRGDHFAAILVPLPCPITSDQSRAKGCIARGTTGAERLARARKLAGRHPLSAVRTENDTGTVFELYALAPYDVGREYLSKGNAECSIDDQAHLALGRHVHYLHHPPPLSVEEDPTSFPEFNEMRRQCSFAPPFLDCFPGLFEPAPGYSPGCWTAAKVTKP